MVSIDTCQNKNLLWKDKDAASTKKKSANKNSKIANKRILRCIGADGLIVMHSEAEVSVFGVESPVADIVAKGIRTVFYTRDNTVPEHHMGSDYVFGSREAESHMPSSIFYPDSSLDVRGRLGLFFSDLAPPKWDIGIRANLFMAAGEHVSAIDDAEMETSMYRKHFLGRRVVEEARNWVWEYRSRLVKNVQAARSKPYPHFPAPRLCHTSLGPLQGKVFRRSADRFGHGFMREVYDCTALSTVLAHDDPVESISRALRAQNTMIVKFTSSVFALVCYMNALSKELYCPITGFTQSYVVREGSSSTLRMLPRFRAKADQPFIRTTKAKGFFKMENVVTDVDEAYVMECDRKGLTDGTAWTHCYILLRRIVLFYDRFMDEMPSITLPHLASVFTANYILSACDEAIRLSNYVTEECGLMKRLEKLSRPRKGRSVSTSSGKTKTVKQTMTAWQNVLDRIRIVKECAELTKETLFATRDLLEAMYACRNADGSHFAEHLDDGDAGDDSKRDVLQPLEGVNAIDEVNNRSLFIAEETKSFRAMSFFLAETERCVRMGTKGRFDLSLVHQPIDTDAVRVIMCSEVYKSLFGMQSKVMMLDPFRACVTLAFFDIDERVESGEDNFALHSREWTKIAKGKGLYDFVASSYFTNATFSFACSALQTTKKFFVNVANEWDRLSKQRVVIHDLFRQPNTVTQSSLRHESAFANDMLQCNVFALLMSRNLVLPLVRGEFSSSYSVADLVQESLHDLFYRSKFRYLNCNGYNTLVNFNQMIVRLIENPEKIVLETGFVQVAKFCYRFYNSKVVLLTNSLVRKERIMKAAKWIVVVQKAFRVRQSRKRMLNELKQLERFRSNLPAERIVAEPIVEERISAEPIVEERISAEPIIEERIPAEPIIEERISAEPILAEPSSIEQEDEDTDMEPAFDSEEEEAEAKEFEVQEEEEEEEEEEEVESKSLTYSSSQGENETRESEELWTQAYIDSVEAVQYELESAFSDEGFPYTGIALDAGWFTPIDHVRTVLRIEDVVHPLFHFMTHDIIVAAASRVPWLILSTHCTHVSRVDWQHHMQMHMQMHMAMWQMAHHHQWNQYHA